MKWDSSKNLPKSSRESQGSDNHEIRKREAVIRSNTELIWALAAENEKNENEAVFEDIMAGNFPHPESGIYRERMHQIYQINEIERNPFLDFAVKPQPQRQREILKRS